MKTLTHAVLALVTGLMLSACNKEPVSTTSETTNAVALSVTSAKNETNASAQFSERTAAVISRPTTATNSTVKILSPLEAKEHVGETATVRGKVFGVHVTQKGDVFMNIGAAFPNAPFTAVCFQGAIPTDDLKKFDGKMVSITGTIKDYNGQTEIVLQQADQISE